MKSTKNIFVILISILILASCSSDDNNLSSDPFVVAFENLSANLSNIESQEDIKLLYSSAAQENGLITININSENAIYGEDFKTEPALIDGKITLPIEQGSEYSTLVFYKLSESLDETTEISFTITEIAYPSSEIRGNSVFILNSQASSGGSIKPEVGGPNEQFQVYVNLSTKSNTQVLRDSWDLAFFSKEGFRVGINGSIYMAAAELQETNIDNISEADVIDLMEQVAVGTFDASNEPYIDYPDGDISRTAINEIELNDAENKVYLVNLGFEVGTSNPEIGDVSVAGDARGWRKIRILRSGDNYLLQYANLNDTNHQEISISKSAGYNATFFSFNTYSIVNVEPEAEQWDLNFTVFTNIIEGFGSYGFTDGVLSNRKAGVKAYSVTTNQFSYDSFNASDVANNNFTEDQRSIGDSWRDVMNDDKVLIDTIFYIVKDPNNNIYKLKFTGLLNDNGARGYPEFKYELLK